MKTGRSISELAIELERQMTTRRDFLAPTTELRMEAKTHVVEDALIVEKTGAEAVMLAGLPIGPVPVNDYAHGQISSETAIPKKYYDRMLAEAPALLAQNVNTWFRQEPKKRMVRTLDGHVRGFLSDRYRSLDNIDLATAAFPVLTDRRANVVSAELTERRLYIKAVLPSLTREVVTAKKGDIVQAGVVISNSEIGAGAVRVEPMIFRLVCTNGMIASDNSLRKYHVGRSADEDTVREVLTDEAKIAGDKAFWLAFRDVLASSFDRDLFNALCDKIDDAASQRIVSNNLPKVVEVTTARLGIAEGLQNSILRHLIEDGDLSRWGLVNAVTRTANDHDDYDTATEIERAGGKILEMQPSDWKVVSEAA